MRTVRGLHLHVCTSKGASICLGSRPSLLQGSGNETSIAMQSAIGCFLGCWGLIGLGSILFTNLQYFTSDYSEVSSHFQ